MGFYLSYVTDYPPVGYGDCCLSY